MTDVFNEQCGRNEDLAAGTVVHIGQIPLPPAFNLFHINGPRERLRVRGERKEKDGGVERTHLANNNRWRMWSASRSVHDGLAARCPRPVIRRNPSGITRYWIVTGYPPSRSFGHSCQRPAHRTTPIRINRCPPSCAGLFPLRGCGDRSSRYIDTPFVPTCPSPERSSAGQPGPT